MRGELLRPLFSGVPLFEESEQDPGLGENEADINIAGRLLLFSDFCFWCLAP